MSPTSDAWFLRFPDGRVMRAASTEAVRAHLENGRIPPDSRARRDHGDPWVPLGRTPAFSDLVRSGRRHDPAHTTPEPNAHNGGPRNTHEPLHLVGARGVIEELMSALDSTLVPGKLGVAVRTGLGLGMLALLFLILRQFLPESWTLLLGIIALVAGLVEASICAVTLTQMTFIELSRLRPSTPEEVRTGLGKFAGRLAGALLLVVGGLLAVLYLLGRAPEWIAPLEPPALAEGLTALVAVLRVLVAVAVWPLLGLALLLGPTVVIEEGSLSHSLTLWGGLLRRHLVRIILYETLAATVAFVVSVPFIFPVVVAAGPALGDGVVAQATAYVAAVLLGLAVSPALAYLTVANVFIYLNLRYEQAIPR
jgi:hypothetical protein